METENEFKKEFDSEFVLDKIATLMNTLGEINEFLEEYRWKNEEAGESFDANYNCIVDETQSLAKCIGLEQLYHKVAK